MWPALDHAVHLGDERGRTRERVEQRQLVRHRGEAVELDERQRERAGDVQAPGSRTRAPTARRRRRTPSASRASCGATTVGSSNSSRSPAEYERHVHRQAGRVGRDRERDRVVGVRIAHRARRQDDDLVRVRADRRVALRAPHDDAVGRRVDDPHVQVGVGLLATAPATGPPSRRSGRRRRRGRRRGTARRTPAPARAPLLRARAASRTARRSRSP